MKHRLLITVIVYFAVITGFSQEKPQIDTGSNEVIFTQNSKDSSQNENILPKPLPNSLEVSARFENFFEQYSNRSFKYIKK